ncbi:helix-turn-helix domain-containing protein [Rubellimicrobium arenae]|uniref:helix-turn-helix domain-containing protein n=1 Tax=Rubellimicrobium arenae TaxID=2817372 RepID=UPI001B312F01|nr:XRE family transcriptional regulator [Rubellimicrobium arenae]
MSRQIGHDLRALRQARDLTLREVAAAVGRSVGWLSQIERGQSTPSVRDLGLLAEQFGISISFFFRSAGRDEAERGLIQRAADRMPIGTTESGLVEELLSPNLNGGFEMIRTVFAPGASSDGPVSPRGAEHGGVLIEGRLHLRVGEREFMLDAGDSFQFAGQDYAWRNDSSVAAVALWVVAPPVY